MKNRLCFLVQGQQADAARQALRGLRPGDDLSLGAKPGRGQVLFRPLSQGAPLSRVRTLVIVLGDQLDLDAAAFDGFDAAQDATRMAEAADESTLSFEIISVALPVRSCAS